MVLLLGLAPPLRAQEAIDPIDPIASFGATRMVPAATDARSAAMGRTGIVAAAGSHGMFANPALIGDLPGPGLQVDARLAGGSADPHLPAGSDADVAASYPPTLAANAISFASPVPFRPDAGRLRFAFGLGYRTYHDLGYRLESEIRYADATTKSDFESRGSFQTLTAALALAYDERLLFGISWDRSLFSENRADSELIIQQTVLRGQRVDALSGQFFTFGTLLRLTPTLSLGAAYRTRLQLEVEEDAELELVQGFAIDDPSVPDAPRTRHVDYELATAAIFGLALAYRPLPALTLAVELQTRAFSDYELDGRRLNVDDGHCYRFGLEYRTPVALRAGVFRDALPVADARPGEDDPLDLLGFTAGLGFEIWQVLLDLAFEYAWWEREYDQGSEMSEGLYTVRLAAATSF